MNASLLDDTPGLMAQLGVEFAFLGENVKISGLRAKGSNVTLRRLQTAEVVFDVTVSGDIAVERLEQFKLELTDQESAGEGVNGGLLSAISIESSFKFVCPPGTRLSASDVCEQCPFPEYTPDSISCERCPEPDRMLPNAVGNACTCANGYYDSWRGHGSRQLDVYCWSTNRLDDALKDADGLNVKTVPDLIEKVRRTGDDHKSDRQCVSCPDCMVCEWQPSDHTQTNILDGENMTVHTVVNQVTKEWRSSASTSSLGTRSRTRTNRLT